MKVIITLTTKEYTANLYRFRVEQIEKQFDITITGVTLLPLEDGKPPQMEVTMSDEDRFTYLLKS